jgi:predicted RNA-binding protein YlqC (UPF0109 family)
MGMKDLVEFLAKSLCDHPEEVVVTEIEEDGNLSIKLQVHPDDKGRVIGKRGRVAESVRVLLRVAAVKKGIRVNLEIV